MQRPLVVGAVVALWICIQAITEKVLVLIPGFSYDSHRTKILKRSLEVVIASGVDCHCLLFDYEEPIERRGKGDHPSTELRDFIKSTCVIYSYHYAHYATYMKSVPPMLLRMGGFTHVFVLLDDVELLDSFNLKEALDIMQRNRLSLAAPIVGKIYTDSNF